MGGRELNDEVVHALRMDTCPDCGHAGLQAGPRGGVSQNLICKKCGARFNVGPPRYIIYAERL